MIPRIIHQMWIGDKSKKPTRLMNTWRDLNPSCEYKVWTEENLVDFGFRNQQQIDDMAELNGKCDIMRFEILYRYGGFFVDADSECINILDDFFFDNVRFTCYENEQVGFDPIDNVLLLGESHMAFEPHDPFVNECILELGRTEMKGKHGWEATGNRFLSIMVEKFKDVYPMKIYPSWYFLPKHGTGMEYKGSDKIYAKHYWGSTFGIYGQI